MPISAPRGMKVKKTIQQGPKSISSVSFQFFRHFILAIDQRLRFGFTVVIAIAFLTCGSGTAAHSQPLSVFVEQSADFAGPFASWLNVKTQYGAKGNGISDDTVALQAALADQPRMNRVIWLPRGTYNISSTLAMTQGFGVTIIGEDPSTTIIKWTGPVGGTMIDFNACTGIQVSRLTLDGNNSAGTGERIWYSPSLPYHYPTYNLISDQTIKNLSVGSSTAKPVRP